MEQDNPNEHIYERKAHVIYSGTQWEKQAVAAGKAMDNRLHNGSGGPYGTPPHRYGMFDVQAWLTWFDWDVLLRRGLIARALL